MDKPSSAMLAGMNAFPEIEKYSGRTQRTRSSEEQPALSGDGTSDISLDTPLQVDQPPTNKEQVEPLDTPTTKPKRRLSTTNSNKASERPFKRKRLTRQNLALFNNTVEPEPESSRATSESQATRSSSSSIPGLAIKAQRNGISLTAPIAPSNLEDLRRCLFQPNDLGLANREEFQVYFKRMDRASNKETVSGAKWLILKDYTVDEDVDNLNPSYLFYENEQFTSFPKNVGFNDTLSPPQPGFIEGLWSKSFGSFPIEELSGAVPYKDNKMAIALPHIAGEWTRPGGNMEQARIKSAYTGAALVYARNQALEYLGKPDPPRHASVITFITDGTLMRFYAHYACNDEEGSLKYYQCLIETTGFTDSYQKFNVCRQGLQNLRDFAKEQAESLRDELKQHSTNPPRPDGPRLESPGPESPGSGAPRPESPGLEGPPVSGSAIVGKILKRKGRPAVGAPKGKRGRNKGKRSGS